MGEPYRPEDARGGHYPDYQAYREPPVHFNGSVPFNDRQNHAQFSEEGAPSFPNEPYGQPPPFDQYYRDNTRDYGQNYIPGFQGGGGRGGNSWPGESPRGGGGGRSHNTRGGGGNFGKSYHKGSSGDNYHRNSETSDNRDEDNDTIYITNLSQNITVDELDQFFSSIGVIKIDKKTRLKKIWIYRDKETDLAKGDATITYEDPAAAKAAVDWFNSTRFQDLVLNVELATKKRDKRADFRSSRGRDSNWRGGGGDRNSIGSSSSSGGHGPPADNSGWRNPPPGNMPAGIPHQNPNLPAFDTSDALSPPPVHSQPPSSNRTPDNRGKPPQFRQGDWPCPNCANMNFARRDKCFKCGLAKPPNQQGGLPPRDSPYGGGSGVGGGHRNDRFDRPFSDRDFNDRDRGGDRGDRRGRPPPPNDQGFRNDRRDGPPPMGGYRDNREFDDGSQGPDRRKMYRNDRDFGRDRNDRDRGDRNDRDRDREVDPRQNRYSDDRHGRRSQPY